MSARLNDIQHFFNTQAFADGLRATVAILLPAIIGSYTGHFEAGVTISLGAMCVSLTDAPGPVIHKRNGMLASTAFIFLIALLTSYARLNVYNMATAIALIAFFFSMFNVYGNRAGAVGNTAILVMIVTMDKPAGVDSIFFHAVLILAGGLFYTGLSLLGHKIRPYRIVQRILGNSIREIAQYLSIKADFYLPHTDLQQNYSNMVAQQILVHEKQEAVREVMFKTRTIVKESTTISRKLLLTFIEAVDLFESITATYYDYALLRKEYEGTGVVESIGQTLKRMSMELEALGKAIEANTTFSKGFDYDAAIIDLKEKIDRLSADGRSTQVLLRILVNIRRIMNSFNGLAKYFEKKDPKKVGLDHSKFISHQSLHPRVLGENLTLQSAVFRHALRVSVASLAGFIITKLIGYGHHSYWVLLTIAFILKPAFSLTKKRNVERIIGTVVGGFVAVLIFYFIPDRNVRFVLMLIFMLGTYSFLRTHYLAMVFFVTPYVLLAFQFFGLPLVDLAGERIIDTIVGCTIAFAASYLLLPTWEAEQLRVYMARMLDANATYMCRIVDVLQGKPVAVLDYKLARKSVYVASANLSSAFQRMLSEPKGKQMNRKDAQEFVVLNHVLFSNIASIAAQVQNQNRTYPEEVVRAARRVYDKLHRSLDLFERKEKEEIAEAMPSTPARGSERELKQQLNYIEKLSGDLEKTSLRLTA